MPTSLAVSAGVLLAALFGWLAVIVFPEDRSILNIPPHRPILYEELPHDTSIADLERGRSYYIQLCAHCHGFNGLGDGEFSYRMMPKPANLISTKTRNKTDEELGIVIRDGTQRSAMQGWGNVLNETQRRQVLQYVRFLAFEKN